MTVLDIVTAYLKQHGFDGLYSDGECACNLDNLAPCGESFSRCWPGYQLPCDCGDHDWHIGEREAE